MIWRCLWARPRLRGKAGRRLDAAASQGRDEDILGLEVAVDDIVLVEALQLCL